MYRSSATILIILIFTNLISSEEKLDYTHPLEPDPNRLSSEIIAFQQFDTLNKPTFGGIVCIGSSSMRMWHTRINEDLPKLTILPRGFGGSHYTDVIYYLDELVLKYKPRAVLIYEGDNDAAYGKSPKRIFSDFKNLIFRCRDALPNLRFYIIGSKPSISRWHIAEDMQKANSLIKAYCHDDSYCTYIDVWPSILGSDGKPKSELFMNDNLHLNSAGYDQWAKAIAPILYKGELNYE